MSSSPIIYPTSSSNNLGSDTIPPSSNPASSMDIPSTLNSMYRGGQTPPTTGTIDHYVPSSDFGIDHLNSYSSQRDGALHENLRSRRHDLGSVNYHPGFFQHLIEPTSSQSRISSFEGNSNNSELNSLLQANGNVNGENRSLEKTLIVWGTNIVVKDVVTNFKDFLENFTLAHLSGQSATTINDSNNSNNNNDNVSRYEPYYPKLLTYLHNIEARYLNLDGHHLRSYFATLSIFNQLLSHPQEMIPIMDMVVNELFLERFPEAEDLVRPFNIERHVNLRELSPSDVDQLITIKGLVIRASPIMPDMRAGFFKCSACDYTLTVDNIKGKIAEPAKCPRIECGTANSMILIHNRCLFSDKQIVKVQETPDSVPDGQTPHAVTVCLYDSLIDTTRPGDRVEITGIFRVSQIRANTHQRKIKSIFRTFIDVVHLKKTDPNRMQVLVTDSILEEDLSTNFDSTGFDQYTIGVSDPDFTSQATAIAADPNLYERLANSIAPSIWKMNTVKKCLLLQLFGGVSKSLKTGSARFRGDIHVLIAGDPSVSKSQLLQFVHKLAPRGIYTSGKGSSAVGLTAYVTRDIDTGQYILESGALVLSDGGICCIDEFDKMGDGTRSVLHEVMEQQTISVAKAGIITTLNARTSILAAANPIDSKYNSEKSIIENLNLPPSLISRFDLICLVLDRPDESSDIQLARHIASLHLPEDQLQSSLLPQVTAPLDIQTMAKYISYARKFIHPVLSDEAMKALADGYISMRKVNAPSSSSANRHGSGGPPRTVSATTRQLESLIRLSEAHARMRLSQLVEPHDVQEAIRLVKNAILSYAIDPITGRIDMDMINTGHSSSLRERASSLKKQVQGIFTSATGRNGIDLSTLYKIISDQSSIYVHERLLREVVRELIDEEWLMISAGSTPHGSTLRSGTILRRLE